MHIQVPLSKLQQEKEGSTTFLISGHPLFAQIDAMWGQKIRESHLHVCLFDLEADILAVLHNVSSVVEF